VIAGQFQRVLSRRFDLIEIGPFVLLAMQEHDDWRKHQLQQIAMEKERKGTDSKPSRLRS
jgi:hypothetical protein